ncbi:MAG: hypothetical protein QMD09_03235, partial [Desulfatibacillaceae bacterium]|nr:hypothetical protein [Desulfatibacillaceae bacterium]
PGRCAQAVRDIKPLDSDGDGHTNDAEIQAGFWPGDNADHPGVAVAPQRVYTLAQLMAMPQHTQFMLLNTHRSGDRYGEFAGVILEDLLEDAGILPNATAITVFSPDGWAQFHPLDQVDTHEVYHVRGVYPPAEFYYDPQADEALNQVDGWCSYDVPSAAGRNHGDPIVVPNGLRMILAYMQEGQFMDPGVLNNDNKLDGQGPFRVVPPQKIPGPPDQSSRSNNQDVIWPFNAAWDHNAGSSTRTVTIIRVEPLPAGTTDIDFLEAGWNFVDQNKVLIYGAIDGTDSNGDGILDSESGSNDANPARTRFRPLTTTQRMEMQASAGQFRQVIALAPDDPSLPAQGRPAASDIPYGATRFRIEGLDAANPNGDEVTVTVTYPADIPATARIYKITQAGWREIPFVKTGARTIEMTLRDGDPATDADGVVNGVIVDPFALAVPAAAGAGAAAAPASSSSGCFVNSLLQ